MFLRGRRSAVAFALPGGFSRRWWDRVRAISSATMLITGRRYLASFFSTRARAANWPLFRRTQLGANAYVPLRFPLSAGGSPA